LQNKTDTPDGVIVQPPDAERRISTTMTPLARYQAELEKGTLSHDHAQEAAVRQMQALYDELVATPEPQPQQGIFRRITGRVRKAPMEAVRGLYIWGSVGRGKTHLVNGFNDALPFPNKLRIHFHRFMQHVHEELRHLKDQSDPLKIVADRLAERARVLCLDEFHVSDIADAMLLARLLEALFERGITLVTTSNIPPDELYKGGLQRERFLPAIELLKEHTTEVHLDGLEDFRLRALEKVEIYHSPLDKEANISLMKSFESLGPENVLEKETVMVEGRPIPTVRTADGIAWFDFTDLCDGPRGTADYIEIARCFHTVLIANIPRMGELDNDRAIRFIPLVDEFSNRSVKLIISAAGSLDDLYYPEGRLSFQFERTTSRLEEMQSREYLHRPHRP
jgi:cell division protein ZapE